MPGVRFLLTILLGAALSPAALAASTRPQVHLVDSSPASVAGAGFQARERVVVRVTGSSGPLSRAVMTTARGSFVAHFLRSVSAQGCHQIAIVAIGSHGDRAAWKSPPKSCGPPPQPIGQ